MDEFLRLVGVLLPYSLLYGAVLSAVATVVILGSLRWNVEIWLNDFPEDVRLAYGPPRNPETPRQRRLVSVVFFLFIIILLIASIAGLVDLLGELTFAAVFTHVLIMLMVFNVVDLVVIDWLALLALRPNWAVLPGTEGLPGYHNWIFPLIDFLKGTVFILFASAVIAGITMLVASLL